MLFWYYLDPADIGPVAAAGGQEHGAVVHVQQVVPPLYRLTSGFIMLLLLLYVQEVVTRPKILNRTFLSNWVHVT